MLKALVFLSLGVGSFAGAGLFAQVGLPAAPLAPTPRLFAGVPGPGLSAEAAPAQVAGAAASAGAPGLTRAEAEALAVRNNPRITVSHLLALAQQQVVREARSGELPQLTGSITAEQAENGSRLASGQLSSSRLLTHVGGGVLLTQVITDFGRLRNEVAASKLRATAQGQREQATQAEIALVADQAFYNALQAQAVLAVARQTVATREATGQQIGLLARNRLRSTLDASFAEVNVSQAKLLLLDAQGGADASMAALDEVLGLDHQQDYTLVPDAGAPPLPPPDVAVLTQMALRQRPDLQALESVREAAEKQARAESDQGLPTLSAIGTVGGTPVRSGRFYPSSYDGAIAANLTVPLFNGFLYSAQAKEASLRAGADQAQALVLRNTIVRDVRTAWLEASSSFARIAVTEQLLGQAGESLKLAQTRYDLGLGSIVELSQAQLAQTQAQIAATDAGYGYRAALARLEFQTGQ